MSQVGELLSCEHHGLLLGARLYHADHPTMPPAHGKLCEGIVGRLPESDAELKDTCLLPETNRRQELTLALDSPQADREHPVHVAEARPGCPGALGDDAEGLTGVAPRGGIVEEHLVGAMASKRGVDAAQAHIGTTV